MSKVLWLDDGANEQAARALEQTLKPLSVIRSEREAASALMSASSAILHVPYVKLRDRVHAAASIRRLPLFWYCCESRMPKDPDWGYSLDGLLFPGMTRDQLEWALQWGARVHRDRKRWLEEKEQLLQRLEERKWVDQAKGILCEIKGLSESEAYDFLRKQAMNERKRIGDVAASIVKVYQLIHG